jgi:hypothetical protein
MFRTARPLLAALFLTTAASAPAQPLIERVPDDALFYFGWAGTDAMGDDYAQSTLKQVIALTDPEQLHAAWRSALPMLRHAVDDPRFNDHYLHLTDLLRASARGAMAAYLTPGPAAADGTPTPALALIWEPTDAADRQALLAGLKFYVDQIPSDRFALSVQGPGVSLRVNDPSVVEVSAVENAVELVGQTLAATPRFVDSVGRLQSTGPIMAYLDLPGLIDWLAPLYETQMGNPEQMRTVSAVLEVLNLPGLGPAMFSAGFDGRRWRTESLLAATAPRTGLASLLEAPALSADDLALPPRGATWVGLLSFDGGKVMDLIRATVTAASPDAADQMEDALAQASSMVGVDVEQQLLRGLGTTWAFYCDPDLAGDSLAGMTLVNPLQDAEGVERGLRAIQMFGNLALLQALEDEWVKLQVHTQTVDGLDIHSFLMPMFAPSWAILDGKLVVGMYPQTLLAAKDRLANPDALMQRPEFEALRETIGTRRLTGLSWVDLPRTADQSYATLLSVEHLLTGLAAIATGQPMPTVLPPLGRLRPHLEPAHSFGWLDDDGWHSVSQSPFPGATLLAPQGTGSGLVGPQAAAVFLPAFGFIRSSATQPVTLEPVPLQKLEPAQP